MLKMSLAIASVLLVLTAGPVLADTYLSINSGALWTDKTDLSIDGYADGSHEYDMGYVFDVAVGRSYANGLRFEMEIPYRFNDVNEYAPEQLRGMEFDREISSLALMANAYYDLPTGTAWRPFVGAGLGYALMQVEGWTTHHDDGVYAYQVMAGCGYELSKKVTLDLQYRFYATEDPEFTARDPATGKVRIDAEYLTQSVMFGLRYSF